MGSKRDGRLASSLGEASLPSSFISLACMFIGYLTPRYEVDGIGQEVCCACCWFGQGATPHLPGVLPA